MRFFEVVLSGAALISAVWAVELNEVPTALEAGKTYTITYSPKDNTPTTFILRKGDPGNLDTIGNIGTATGGSFEWTVPSDLVDAPNYAFEVQQAGAEPNYSGLIPLTGGSGEEETTTSSSSSAASSGYPTKTPTPSSSGVTTTTESSKTTAAPSGTGSLTTPGANSTITTATLSRTSTGSGAPTTTGPGSPPAEQTGAAALFGSSPLALLVGAAAMAYFN
jgi:hypothetical protein